MSATREQLRALLYDLRANGIAVDVVDDALRVEPWSAVEPIEREMLREYHAELRELLTNNEHAGAEDQQHAGDDDQLDRDSDHQLDRDGAVPELFVYGVRVTERHVRDCLKGDCDQRLADYDAGRLSVADAYSITAEWLRSWMNMVSGNPRPFGRGNATIGLPPRVTRKTTP